MQRLLNHTVYAGFDRIRERVGHAFLNEIAGDPAAPLKIFKLKLQGRSQAQVTQ